MKKTRRMQAAYVLGLLATATLSYSRAVVDELKGYKLISKSYVLGEFEGADFEKQVELDNGMVFEFNEYHYTYSYRPSAEVYAKTFSITEQKAIGIKNPKQPVTLYKLLVKDHVYTVFRIR